MCSRFQFSTHSDAAAVRRLLARLEAAYPAFIPPDGEVLPNMQAPILVAGVEKLGVLPARWGFPGSGGQLVINARSETAAEKPMFRDSLRTRRCALLTTGFYEWSHDGRRQKYLLRKSGEPVTYLAGLYQIVDGEPRFVVLTRPPHTSMNDIHDRMPVILEQKQLRQWLQGNYTELLHSPEPWLDREAQ